MRGFQAINILLYHSIQGFCDKCKVAKIFLIALTLLSKRDSFSGATIHINVLSQPMLTEVGVWRVFT